MKKNSISIKYFKLFNALNIIFRKLEVLIIFMSFFQRQEPKYAAQPFSIHRSHMKTDEIYNPYSLEKSLPEETQISPEKTESFDNYQEQKSKNFQEGGLMNKKSPNYYLDLQNSFYSPQKRLRLIIVLSALGSILLFISPSIPSLSFKSNLFLSSTIIIGIILILIIYIIFNLYKLIYYSIPLIALSAFLLNAPIATILFGLGIILILIAFYHNLQYKHQNTSSFSFQTNNVSPFFNELLKKKPTPPTKDPAQLFRNDILSQQGNDNNFDSNISFSSNPVYFQSDRISASSSITQSDYLSDSNIKKLHEQTLEKLKLTSNQFNKYLSKMKEFISQSILSKIIKHLHSEQPFYYSMTNIPGYESNDNRKYISDRLKNLSLSKSLSSHNGDRGARETLTDQEWTTKRPSDNQIILHVLSVCFSRYMAGKSRMQFKQKYIFLDREPKWEKEGDILICAETTIDGKKRYYIYTTFESSQPDKFWAFDGYDSLYCVLTIFFWIVKEKYHFLLDGADLCDTPFFMNKIFSD